MRADSSDIMQSPSGGTDDDFVEVVFPIQVQEMDRESISNVYEVAQQDPEEESHAVMMGACVAGGCIGCLIGGPYLGCVVGSVSAYGTTNESAAGECTRSMGRLAMSCGRKAAEMNEKHHVVEKTCSAGASCWGKIQDMSEHHKIKDRTIECFSVSWEAAKDANNKHRLVERCFQSIGSMIVYLNEKVAAVNTNESAALNNAENCAIANEGENLFQTEEGGSYTVAKTESM